VDACDENATSRKLVQSALSVACELFRGERLNHKTRNRWREESACKGRNRAYSVGPEAGQSNGVRMQCATKEAVWLVSVSRHT